MTWTVVCSTSSWSATREVPGLDPGGVLLRGAVDSELFVRAGLSAVGVAVLEHEHRINAVTLSASHNVRRLAECPLLPVCGCAHMGQIVSADRPTASAASVRGDLVVEAVDAPVVRADRDHDGFVWRWPATMARSDP